MTKTEAIRILRDMIGDLDQAKARPIEYTTKDQRQAVTFALDNLIGTPKRSNARTT